MDDSTGVTLSVLKELQQRHNVRASRALGQNFLVDPNISRKISEVIPAGLNVIEVGPGIGSLTVPLARRCKSVHAIEYDEHILEPLSDVLKQFDVSDNVTVHHEDVMNVDLEQLCRNNDVHTIMGNLPYNISAPLLATIARSTPSATTVVAMVQKEVGERLSSPLKTRAVSSITLKCQFFMDIEIAFAVPRQSFIPQPRVDSVVITMKRRDNQLADIPTDEVDAFFMIIDTAFNQRRKMLRQSLKAKYGENLNNVFQAADVDPTLRPEACDLDDFARLYKAIRDAAHGK